MHRAHSISRTSIRTNEDARKIISLNVCYDSNRGQMDEHVQLTGNKIMQKKNTHTKT